MLTNNPSPVSSEQWNTIISKLPGAHILQTWEWGKIKSQFGWQPHFLIWLQNKDQNELVINKHLDKKQENSIIAASLLLHRKITIGGLSHRTGVIYLPKGPLLDWSNKVVRSQVLGDLKSFAQKHSAIFIKIDPDVEVGSGIPGMEGSTESPLGIELSELLKTKGWLFSDEQIQFRNTVLIDLRPDLDELLANMKQKTRYNINLATRKGVTIHSGKTTDLHMLYQMYAETSIRDDFVIRNERYYQEVWNTYLANQASTSGATPVAEALIAEADDSPVAGAIILRFAGKAWFLYGMSTQTHRDKMPNYLLQWEAIKRAKAGNCQVYDLWGAPDIFVESDPLWGVYRFKEGLGGSVHRYLGAWDLPINRVLYRLYSRTLPGLLDIMRAQGKASKKTITG